MTNSLLNIAALIETVMDELRETLRGNDEGQGMVEYGLILAIVSIAAIVALGLMAPAISAKFTQVTTALATPTS